MISYGQFTRTTMYLIRSDDAESLRRLAGSLDAINDFVHCDLGSLNTLELTELCNNASSWISGQPIVYDELNGLAIFSFNSEGVAWLAHNPNALTEYNADVGSLSAFAEASGAVYALDTF